MCYNNGIQWIIELNHTHKFGKTNENIPFSASNSMKMAEISKEQRNLYSGIMFYDIVSSRKYYEENLSRKRKSTAYRI